MYAALIERHIKPATSLRDPANNRRHNHRASKGHNKNAEVSVHEVTWETTESYATRTEDSICGATAGSVVSSSAEMMRGIKRAAENCSAIFVSLCWHRRRTATRM